MQQDNQPDEGIASTLPGRASPARGVVETSGFPPTAFHGYRIRHLLGEGAMGEVYLASDVQLDREVVIKFIKPESTGAERFATEARAAAKLQHPNIASVYAVGEVQGRPFIVSEYVRGQSLHTLALPVPWPRALQIGFALTRGVAAVHRAGVLHRDIKPANVVLSESGEPKLVDFGLAKLLDIGDVPIVPVATDKSVLGTPHYVAPEIWNDEPASTRTDVYALGVLLYHLCAGYQPHFSAASLRQLQEMIVTQDAPALVELRVDPNLSKGLEKNL